MSESGGPSADEPLSAADAIAFFNRFGRNLSELARQGRLDPVIARDDEIDRVVEVLCRRDQNIPLLVADIGISTDEVLEGVAHRILSGEVPDSLRQAAVVELDTLQLSAAIKHEGASEQLTSAINGLRGVNSLILCLTRIEAIAGSSSADRTCELLRSVAIHGGVSLVGVTDVDSYRLVVEPDTALSAALQPVQIDEPSIAHTIELLKGQRERYEIHHRLVIDDDALVTAAVLADAYITDRFLPESAFDLLDEASGIARTRRVPPSPELAGLIQAISDVRERKEAAIDEQDFEAAARFRDEEKNLMVKRRDAETIWREDSANLLLEVDTELVIEAVRRRTSKEPGELRRRILRFGDLHPAGQHRLDADRLKLLNDAPLTSHEVDLLEISEPARRIAELLATAPTPFAFAVDGSWGVGKSTLLRRIEDSTTVSKSTVIVHFNAWTARGDSALESLIKSVLYNLDDNTLRRTYKKLRGNLKIRSISKLISMLLARLVGGQRFVDNLWTIAGGDDSTRNELKSVIQDLLTEWVNSSEPGTNRRILVFIDDLDRCSSEVVLRICEAVKLYLDAPGLQFVLACDMSVLARGVAEQMEHSLDASGRTYLEKVVQVVYHLPPASPEVTRFLVEGFAQQSGVLKLLTDDAIVDLLIERSSGNPRRIKRIVNSFVLEFKLDNSWGVSPLRTSQLMSIIILRHLYPEFLAWATSAGAGADPVGDFLDYASVRRAAANPPMRNVRWWSSANKYFLRHGVKAIDRSQLTLSIKENVADVESRYPMSFPSLAQDQAFCDFLSDLGDRADRTALLFKLANRPSLSLGEGSELRAIEGLEAP